MKKSSINIVGLAVCATFFLTSCAGGTDEPVKDPEPTATLQETTGPEETPEPEEPVVEEPVEPEEPELTADDFENGDEVEVEKGEKLPEGVKAYELADGTKVVVKEGEETPERVVDDITIRVKDETPKTGAKGGQAKAAEHQGVDRIAAMASMDTGKTVIVVQPMFGNCPGDPEPYAGWYHTRVPGSAFDCLVLPTKKQALDRIHTAIAEKPNPADFVVVEHPNGW